MKVLHGNGDYELKGNLINDTLCLDLTIVCRESSERLFSTEVCFHDLCPLMKKNFDNMSNLFSYISDSSLCKIDA